MINDNRGKFYQRLFQQTLPGFIKEFDPNKRNIIMLDADLYSATLYMLTSLQCIGAANNYYFTAFKVN